MFFTSWPLLFRRSPKLPLPEYRVGQLVKILPTPDVARVRYFVVRARVWRKEDENRGYQWIYEGSVWAGSSLGTLSFRAYVLNVPEDRLAYIRGGEYGLPEDK